MLKKVTITNYLGHSMTYSFDNPTIEDKSGLLITEIKGLGPVKADINMTELATDNGAIYNSRRMEGRNIVISARFTYAKTIEEARLLSYKYFPIGQRITFRIETDNRIGETTGYVESNEPDIFSDESDMQVSVVCESPWFLSAADDGTNRVNFSAVEAWFEFPYSNEGHEPDTEFGRIIHKKENTVYYDGDTETGCTIHMHAIGDVRMITIYNIKTREIMSLDTTKLETLTGSGMVYGDDITICTIKGKKSITLTRNGVDTNILNILGKETDWFQLARGDNLFAYTCEYGEENLQFMIEATITFEGV